MKNIIILILSVLLLFLFSCRQNELDPRAYDNQGLIEFRFDSVINPSLPGGSYFAEIDGDSIYISLPPGTDRTSLIPEFTYNGKGVQVDGVWQKSGEDSQNFTSSVYYDLVKEDNSRIQYQVIAGYGDNAGADIYNFWFDGAGNASLGSNVFGVIERGKITFTFPFGTDPSAISLIPSFDVPAGSVVKYDNTEIFSFAAPAINPFSGGTLSVQTPDGLTQLYRFECRVDSQSYIHVAMGGTITGSGSQSDPINDLEEAILRARALNLTEIRIQAGNYNLTNNLFIAENISLKGGYPNWSWSDRQYMEPWQRTDPNFATVISLSGGTAGSMGNYNGTINYTGNIIGSSSRLEGLRIQSSASDYSSSISCLDGASPIIQHCDLISGSAGSGASVFVRNASPTIYSSQLEVISPNESIGLCVSDYGEPELASSRIFAGDGNPAISVGIQLNGISPGGKFYNNYIEAGGSSITNAVRLSASGGEFANNIFAIQSILSSDSCFYEMNGNSKPHYLQNNNFSVSDPVASYYMQDGTTPLFSIKNVNKLGYADSQNNLDFKFADYYAYENASFSQALPSKIAYSGKDLPGLWPKDMRGAARTVFGSQSWSIGPMETDYTYLDAKAILVQDRLTSGYDGTWAFLNLREAVILANAQGKTDVIYFADGPDDLIVDLPIQIKTSMSIVGPKTGTYMLDGNMATHIFEIDDGNKDNEIEVYIANLMFSSCNSPTEGGAIRSGEKLYIYNCEFFFNTAVTGGGALYQYGGELVLSNTVFNSNTASNPIGSGLGGAVYVQNSAFMGMNMLFSSNISNGEGSAFFLENTPAQISFSTFRNNDTGMTNGTVYSTGANLLVANSIFTGNIADPTPDVVVTGGGLGLVGNIIQSPAYNNPPQNIDTPPNFFNPSDERGPDSLWMTVDDGLHASDALDFMVDQGYSGYILPDWPDADNDGNTTEDFPFDIAGNPRLIGSGYDAGAYESY